jgi:hypothetical protein
VTTVAPSSTRLQGYPDLFDTLVGQPLNRSFHVFDLADNSGVVRFRLRCRSLPRFFPVSVFMGAFLPWLSLYPLTFIIVQIREH